MKGSQIQVCHSSEIADYKERILQVVCLRSLTAFGQVWGFFFYSKHFISYVVIYFVKPTDGVLGYCRMIIANIILNVKLQLVGERIFKQHPILCWKM